MSTARPVPAPAPAAARVPTAIAVPVAAPSPIAMSLPDDDEGERTTLQQLALAARDDLAKTLGLTAPPRVVVRVHPTTQSYERATSQSWFTSGALVGEEVPLPQIAERVNLETGWVDDSLDALLVETMRLLAS